MRPNIRTLEGTLLQGSFAGTAKKDTITLPKDFALQRILLDVRGTVTFSAGSTLVEDAVQALLNAVQLKLTGSNGVETVFDLSGADMYVKNYFDYGVAGERVVPTSGSGVAVSVQLVADFRLAKNDPDDFSVAIPLYALSSADLILDWVASATGYGTNITSISLTVNVTMFEGIPETAEEKANQRKAPMLTQIAKQFTCDSSSASEENREQDIATGSLIRRLFIIAKTSAGARSDTEFDYFTFKTATEIFFEKVQWEASQMQDKFDYSLATFDGDRTYKGVTILDFARAPVDERGRVLGFDSRGLKQGDLKLKIFKNNASSKVRYIQENVEG